MSRLYFQYYTKLVVISYRHAKILEKIIRTILNRNILTKKQRIEAFVALGDFLLSDSREIGERLAIAAVKNPWYTPDNVRKQVRAICENLTEEKLESWLSSYPDISSARVVGLILAGNVPLVGFHDIMCVLLSGFHAQIKVSSDDAGLTTFVLEKLVQIAPAFAQKIQLVERLSDFDLIIATGSTNSSRYFEYYFGKKPHIIRKNRNSVALLTGEEDKEALTRLGYDIFDYFGLGCRSVSKLLVPQGYDMSRFFEAIEGFSDVANHHKYRNNYDYNKSIYLINKDRHFDNGFLLLKEDPRMASPLGVVFFEEYENLDAAASRLSADAGHIQCLVTEATIETAIPTFSLGNSQCPGLTDYADGVDVLRFLFAHAPDK